MRRSIPLVCFAALAGCSAADDPDNVPVKGMWSMEYRVSSIRAGSVFLSGDDLPSEFRALARTARTCIEPRLATREDFFEDFASYMEGQCEMKEYEVTDTTMRAKGFCRQVAKSDYDPTLVVRGDIAPENLKLVLTFDGPATLPDFGRRAVEMIAVVEGQRTGDC